MKNNKIKAKTRVIACVLGCTLLLSGCAPQEQIKDDVENTGASSGNDTAVYQARLMYYESQLKSLEEQLTTMDEQMAELQAEYLEEAQSMQEEIEALRADNQRLQEEVETTKQSSSEGDAQSGNDTPKNPEPHPENVGTDQNSDETQGSGREGVTSAYTYQTTQSGIILTKYIGKDSIVTVPAALDGQKVIGLADSVFAGTQVTKVVLPETVQTLGWFTFYGCTALCEVSIPASVTNIGYASFDGCSSTLTLTVAENSYAQKYAASFALRYTVADVRS
ncbi:MAG: leucine-rich repeat protein [Clostridia bacterium]|nr:leucine-rich repeat protein [Clostridia bacterium]